MEPELFKWAISQGALAAVLLIVIAWWRYDFKRFQAKDEEKIGILIDIISKNTASATRLAELIEKER